MPDQHYWVAPVAGAALLALAGSAAWAENGPPEQQPEPPAQNQPIQNPDSEVVYVTARRQTEKAQDVPIPLTTVSGYDLDQDDVNNLSGLTQFIPSLQVLSFNPRNTAIMIRGLGANVGITNDGIEPGVGVYVDGVLYARPAESLFDIPDLSSIEELRGPQGTLYGKNAVAGAVNINTALPGEVFEARGSVGFGTYGYERDSASISGPITDDGSIAFRLSTLYSHHNGYFTNITTGQLQDDYGNFSVRGQLVYRESPYFSVRTIADFESYSAAAPVREISGVVTTLANGQPVPRNFYQRSLAAGYTPLPANPYARLTDTNSPVYSKMEQAGLSTEMNWYSSGYTVTSISALRTWTWRPGNDDDLTPLSVLTQSRMSDNEREVTQEFRLASPRDRPVVVNTGVFYLWEQDDGAGTLQYGQDAPLWILGSAAPTAVATLDGYTITAKSNPRVNSYAAYGQAIWHIFPRTDVIGGLRFTYEYKTGGYDQQANGASLTGLTTQDQATANAIRSQFGAANAYSIRTANDLLGGLATLAYHVTDSLMGFVTWSHEEKSAGLNLAKSCRLRSEDCGAGSCR